jgi:diaminopimelate decarboxylase
MPEPSPGPWPGNAVFDERGLVIAGVAAVDLAERFGTPLLVVDEEQLRTRARTFARLFPHPLYAVKAFTSHEMIRLVAEEGLDLLAATDGELRACLSAGIPGSRIVLHGNNKSDEELVLAVSAGVRLVNVDNPTELERLDRIAGEEAAVQPILLRVVPGVGAGAHRAIRTGQPGSKFGIPLAQVPAAVRRATELRSVDLVGLHAHIGSQVLDVEPYLEEVDVLLDLLAELRKQVGFEADIVDVGGGFGVAYTDEAPLRLDEVAPALLARVRSGAERRGLRAPHTLCEPGRSVVGDAMVTLYRVGTVKRTTDGRVLVAVDGGMSDNIRPMLYGARYTVAPADPPRGSLPSAIVDVVGRHCESGDVLAHDVTLPAEPGPGDLLAFAGTGAYTYSMASTYNRVGRPPVVAVRDGTSRVWLRREDGADLERLEAGRPVPATEVAAPEGVVIRPATPEDAEGALDLYRRVAAEGRFIRTERVSGTVRDLRRRLRRAWTPQGAILVATVGDEVVGSLDIRREEHPVTRHVATFGMHVAPDRRRKGIGAALVTEATRWAREMEVEKLELSVYPDNVAAVSLYRRFGFVPEGRLLRHSKKSHGYEDEILMGMWLGAQA